tara:strand:- start:4161 stop:4373 length:213 start_codon:yes stop_codon:yes gene_type:complete
MPKWNNWREEELERLKQEYTFYKATGIRDKITGGLRSQTLKWIIDYHERMLGLKFWDYGSIKRNGNDSGH